MSVSRLFHYKVRNGPFEIAWDLTIFFHLIFICPRKITEELQKKIDLKKQKSKPSQNGSSPSKPINIMIITITTIILMIKNKLQRFPPMDTFS